MLYFNSTNGLFYIRFFLGSAWRWVMVEKITYAHKYDKNSPTISDISGAAADADKVHYRGD